MTEVPLARLLRLISGTREQELSCTECFDRLSGYVDREVGAGDAARAMPELAHHLQQCGVCHEEYEVLCDLVRADAARAAPGDDPPDGPSA